MSSDNREHTMRNTSHPAGTSGDVATKPVAGSAEKLLHKASGVDNAGNNGDVRSSGNTSNTGNADYAANIGDASTPVAGSVIDAGSAEKPFRGAEPCVLCMDMDAYFASVEQAANPKLKGKPIAVIGSKERTVVVTSSYEARARGVRTGMTKFEAMRVCPELILVTGGNKKYTYISKQIHEFLLTITPHVEAYSIDESFLDITGLGDPEDISFLIKSFVKEKFGITCSIGAGANKLIAKMASGVMKPDGYYRVPFVETQSFIDTFPLKELWGIGRRMAKRFADLGLFTPADVRTYGLDNLTTRFGKTGAHLYHLVCGDSGHSVTAEEEAVKSIGHSMTFPADVMNEKDARAYLLQLSEMVSARARNNRYSGKTVTLTIRYSDMQGCSRMRSLPYFTSATHHIFESALELLHELAEYPRGIRLLGVSLSKLVDNCVTLSNLEDSGKGWEQIYGAIDAVNNKFGKATISFGAVLKCGRKGAQTISPAWRPEGTRSVDVS